MGQQQSQSRVFNSDNNNLDIKLSNSLISDLSDDLLNKEGANSPTDQVTLDEQIRNRINSELRRLRNDEYAVRQQIEQELAKENTDKDNSLISSDNVANTIKDIKQKVDRHNSKRDLNNFPAIKSSQSELVSCLTTNKDRPLDCHVQMDGFKQAVADAEKVSEYFHNDIISTVLYRHL